MTLAILFWVIFVVAIVFFGYRNRGIFVDSLPVWILIGILGFKVFGF